MMYTYVDTGQCTYIVQLEWEIIPELLGYIIFCVLHNIHWIVPRYIDILYADTQINILYSLLIINSLDSIIKYS